MQALRLAHLESSMNWGGQELRVIEQMEWMIAHGYKVWLVARPGSAILAEAEKRSIPHFSLKIRGSSNPITLYHLLRFLGSKKINLIDCHSNKEAYYGLWVRFLTRVKVIRSRHISNPVKTSHGRSIVWRHGNDHIITTANTVSRQIVSRGLAPVEKVYTAIPGVDEHRFHPQIDSSQLRTQLGIPCNHTVIANIGMIRIDKGQLYYARACNQLLDSNPQLSCIQIGEATQHSTHYKAKVTEEVLRGAHTDRFHFLGYHDDIENYLAIADIVVIASIGTEAQTRLVSQAFLMKKAVVATRTGGLPEMIHNQHTGLLCEAENAEALATAVQTVLNNRELRKTLTANAYAYALQHMTMEKMMNEMTDVYEQTLRRK